MTEEHPSSDRTRHSIRNENFDVAVLKEEWFNRLSLGTVGKDHKNEHQSGWHSSIIELPS